MRVIDKREEDKREEWHVGDIIRFGNHTVNENYGMIVHISSCSDSINLIELKGHHFKRGYTGFYMYPSTATLKEKLCELYRFVENMGNADIDEVFSKVNNAPKYNYGDILMCKYQKEDKEFDLYRISNNAAHNYTVNLIHECIGNENAFAITEAPSAEELVNLLKKRMDYEIVEKVPAYIVLGELKDNEK